MITPLKKTALHDLMNKPILFDANIFMVGIESRVSNNNCSFENMKQLYIQPLFESFTDIYVHREVYKELDKDIRAFADMHRGKNVTVVDEGGLYGTDPKYTTIFNKIACHELEDLKDIDIITFDIVVLIAYIYYARKNDNTYSKALKAIYKRYCADVIKRHGLPKTLGEYIVASQNYL